jgi:hypothetical protein
MSKKTKSETVAETKRENTVSGGYNPESWPEEWSRKKKESEKSKGYPAPADILPACDMEGDNAETE